MLFECGRTRGLEGTFSIVFLNCRRAGYFKTTCLCVLPAPHLKNQPGLGEERMAYGAFARFDKNRNHYLQGIEIDPWQGLGSSGSMSVDGTCSWDAANPQDFSPPKSLDPLRFVHMQHVQICPTPQRPFFEGYVPHHVQSCFKGIS